MTTHYASLSPEARERHKEGVMRARRARLAKAQADPEALAAIRAQQAAENARRTARVRALVREAKTGPCVDCGRDDLPPEVMDLDHVRGVKAFSLANAANRGHAAVTAEIAKCDLRCPTCHALRHYRERTQEHGRYV